jgi:hypothetical protein
MGEDLPLSENKTLHKTNKCKRKALLISTSINAGGCLKYHAGHAQQQQRIADPSAGQRGRHKITNPQLSKKHFKEKEKLVMGPDGGLTPRQTGRRTVGRKITLTLTESMTTPKLQNEHNIKQYIFIYSFGNRYHH